MDPVEKAEALKNSLYGLAKDALSMKNGEPCDFTLEELNERLRRLEEAVFKLVDCDEQYI